MYRRADLNPALLAGLFIVGGGAAAAAGGPPEDANTQAAQAGAPRRRPKLALGAAIAFFEPTGNDHSSSLRPQPLLRPAARRAGWAPAVGLDWFATDVQAVVAGVRTPLGKLRVRPLMAGASYWVPVGRASAAFSLMGGYAFNSAVLDNRAGVVYRDRLGRSAASLEVGNSLVLSSGLSLWYGITPRMSVMAAASHLVVRPEVAIVTSAGRDTTSHKADSVVVKAGIAFNVF